MSLARTVRRTLAATLVLAGIVAHANDADAAVTAALTVEYVDTSGARQTVNVVDGVTSISGVAPFLVHFDATDTRSTASTGDDAEGAFRNIGYRINYGEELGTTWTYPTGFNYSMDEDEGPPIFGRAFTVPGTHTVKLRVKDSQGTEDDISLTVVVAASSTLTTVHIPVTEVAWPTFESSRRYTLDAGEDYSALGCIHTDTLHNVVFEKTGTGADPIIDCLRPESREWIGSGGKSLSTTRAAHIRTYEIDVKDYGTRAMGADYSGVVNGRCRRYTAPGHGFEFDQRVMYGTEAQANTVRLSRGVFLWNCGQMSATDSYVIIDGARAMHVYGVQQVHDGTGNEHNTRGVFQRSSWRYGNVYNLNQHKSWFKFQGAEQWDGEEPTTWRSDDRVGDYAGGVTLGRYGYPSSYIVVHRMQLGNAGENLPTEPAGFGPQNADQEVTGVEVEGVEYSLYEDVVAYDDSNIGDDGNAINLGGRYLGVRNVRMDMGAGAYVQYAEITGIKAVKIPDGWAVGYLQENANTRPITSEFGTVNVVQVATPTGQFGDPVTVAFAAPATNGNTIVTIGKVADTDAPIAGVSDDGSNSYSLDYSTDSEGVAPDSTINFYRAANVANAPETISWNLANDGLVGLWAFELSGVDASTPVGTTATNNGTSAAPTVSFSTSSDHQAGFALISASYAFTASNSDGWIEVPGGGSEPTYVMALYIEDLGAAGSKSLTLSVGGSVDWSMSVITFAP